MCATLRISDAVGEHSNHSYSSDCCKCVIYALENDNRIVSERN
jgi:hypothetical protein